MFIDSVNQSTGTQFPTTTESTSGAAPAADTDDVMLPDPLLDLMSSGDPIDQIAALMTQSFRQDRKQARESARIEERNIMAEGRKRVEAMHDQADAIRKEAYMRGATQIASGGMTLAGALEFGSGDDAKSGAIDKAGENAAGKSAGAVAGDGAGDAAGTVSVSYGGVLRGSAKATEGIGGILAGGYEGEQTDLRGDAAEHETLSDAAKRRSEEYRDQVRDARETLDKIADFLREARASQNDASKAAILRA